MLFFSSYKLQFDTYGITTIKKQIGHSRQKSKWENSLRDRNKRQTPQKFNWHILWQQQTANKKFKKQKKKCPQNHHHQQQQQQWLLFHTIISHIEGP